MCPSQYVAYAEHFQCADSPSKQNMSTMAGEDSEFGKNEWPEQEPWLVRGKPGFYSSLPWEVPIWHHFLFSSFVWGYLIYSSVSLKLYYMLPDDRNNDLFTSISIILHKDWALATSWTNYTGEDRPSMVIEEMDTYREGSSERLNCTSVKIFLKQ